MRNTAIVLLLFLCSFQCRRDCLPGTLQFQWIGFSSEQVDTIIVRSYLPGQIGAALQDTVFAGVNEFYFADNAADTLKVAGSVGGLDLQPGYDYEIFLPGVSKTYRITSIEQEQDTPAGGCNNKIECLTRISTVNVDGFPTVVYNWNTIYLRP